MTREENLHWIDEEIRTWENECQSKHPIKEALYAARKALEQEPKVHAKILIKPNPRDEYDTYHYCSNCNEVLPIYYDKLNYCPNCGADMREVQEDDR